jgi:hypothetical protein
LVRKAAGSAMTVALGQRSPAPPLRISRANPAGAALTMIAADAPPIRARR